MKYSDTDRLSWVVNKGVCVVIEWKEAYQVWAVLDISNGLRLAGYSADYRSAIDMAINNQSKCLFEELEREIG